MKGENQREGEMPLHHAGAAVVPNGSSDRVLLVRYKRALPGKLLKFPDMYGLPSMRMQPLQTLETNSVQSARLEAGVDISPTDLVTFPDNSFSPQIMRRANGDTTKYLMHGVLYSGTRSVEPALETPTTLTTLVTPAGLEYLDREGKLLPNVRKMVINALSARRQNIVQQDSLIRFSTSVGGLTVIGDTRTPELLTTSIRPKVDWWITEFCNYTCDFCWVDTIDVASLKEGQNAPLMTLLNSRRPLREKIAQKITESDAEDVTLCGGEPLLIDPLELNEYGRMWRESGKKVTINTNGSLLKRYFAKIEAAGERPEVDRIKISLDGADEDGVKDMRGRNASFKRIEEGVELAKQYGIEVVLTTMVGGNNMNEVPRIAEVIQRLQPVSWRLLEYSDRENNADRHNIVRSDFAFFANWASKRVGPLPVMPSDNDLNAGCFIIDQRGNRQIPTGDTYIQGPNCFDIPINQMWAEDPNIANVINNKYWQHVSGSEYRDTSQLPQHESETVLYDRQAITSMFG